MDMRSRMLALAVFGMFAVTLAAISFAVWSQAQQTGRELASLLPPQPSKPGEKISLDAGIASRGDDFDNPRLDLLRTQVERLTDRVNRLSDLLEKKSADYVALKTEHDHNAELLRELLSTEQDSTERKAVVNEIKSETAKTEPPADAVADLNAQLRELRSELASMEKQAALDEQHIFELEDRKRLLQTAASAALVRSGAAAAPRWPTCSRTGVPRSAAGPRPCWARSAPTQPAQPMPCTKPSPTLRKKCRSPPARPCVASNDRDLAAGATLFAPLVALSLRRQFSGVGKDAFLGRCPNTRKTSSLALPHTSRGARRLRSAPMGLLLTGQESPVEGLVLAVVLAQRQRGHGLGHLVAQVEGVAGVEVRAAARLRACSNSVERVGPGAGACRPLITCSSPVLGEQAVVAVGDLGRPAGQSSRRRAAAASGRGASPAAARGAWAACAACTA